MFRPLLLISIVVIIPQSGMGQILFSQECFEGGVTVVGVNKDGNGGLEYNCELNWESDFSIRSAYLICYRFGQPPPQTILVNGSAVLYDYDSQIGPEFPYINPLATYYATHVVEVTNQIDINSENFTFQWLPLENPGLANWGWHSAHLVIRYESPSISSMVCNTIYIANQPQDTTQTYSLQKPYYTLDRPLLFSIFSSRISNWFSDSHNVFINGLLIGTIWQDDMISPTPNSGVQGSFYYQDGAAEGLNGDTANTTLWRHDGIADIRDYLVDDISQVIFFGAGDFGTNDMEPNSANLVPAFTLTYVPECNTLPDLSDLEREYSFCRGDTVQLTTSDSYESFSWSTASGLSDSTSSSPLCFADSSHWYTVRIWNEGEEGCGQTIPIHVEVYDNPVPQSLTIRSSLCPASTGQVIANDTPGNQPITYNLNGTENTTGAFEDLAPGTYDLSITTATGCTWETTETVLLNPVQEASFTATPETGFSPLDVFFNNTSTQATDYQWLIDGVPVSESEDITYTFPDSGSFEVSLIAYRLEESCADTATLTLRVEPGIKVLLPNIITPNGDGRNDALVAQVQGIASCRWVIYNRWGNEVASGADNDVFQKIELWQPESEVSAGQYTVVLVAEGKSAFAEATAGKVEKFTFGVTLTK